MAVSKCGKICTNLFRLNLTFSWVWVFFTFFKLYKWYQIAQRITYMSIFTEQNKTINLHSLHSHQYSFRYNYQHIVISNIHIISQIDIKIDTLHWNMRSLLSGSTFLQYVYGCTNALLLFQKQKTLRVTENYLHYRFVWTKFWTTLLAAFT